MRIRRLVGGVLVACATAAAWVLACGPFVQELPTIAVSQPADEAAYARGVLGVVRPRLARRYLVQAYRVLAGRPPLAASIPGSNDVGAAGASPPAEPAQDRWADAAGRVLHEPPASIEPMRRVPGGDYYEQFLNCPDSAFAFAVRTLEARTQRYGESSAIVRDWTRAQQAVFQNCSSDTPVIPAPLAPSADPAVRADRAYQIAAAYFYAVQYDEAGRRFRDIAADAASPWRSFGHYLAARSTIRAATMPENISPEQQGRMKVLLAAAETELKSVVADPAAASVHPWARQLLDYVAARIHPIARLHEVSRVLAASPTATSQDFDDYRWLMDQLVGDTLDYPYPNPTYRDEMVSGDDLTDWVLAMQGHGDAAVERAVTRWQATRSMPWLVAALWRLEGVHPTADAVLDAARAVDRASPAFATVAFLRVRLLGRLGRRDQAKSLLATLPDLPGRGIDAETLNLLKAERLLFADSLDEFLANAPRTVVVNDLARAAPPPSPTTAYDEPVIGDDAAVVLNDWLPLDRLVDAAVSPVLPARLRVRVANAAFSRAVVLRRDEAGIRVAPALRELAPRLRADVDRYVDATNADDRHVAAVFLLLRTPGMHAMIQTPEDDDSYDVDDPAADFDRLLHRNWWCNLHLRIANGKLGEGSSELMTLLYPGRRVPAPSFITPDDRAAAGREMQALAAAGAMRSYLGAEALKWARDRRRDIDVAEALALTVQGWHFGCGDDGKWDIARQAFTVLHRQFPQSEWAKRTKYWYK